MIRSFKVLRGTPPQVRGLNKAGLARSRYRSDKERVQIRQSKQSAGEEVGIFYCTLNTYLYRKLLVVQIKLSVVSTRCLGKPDTMLSSILQDLAQKNKV